MGGRKNRNRDPVPFVSKTPGSYAWLWVILPVLLAVGVVVSNKSAPNSKPEPAAPKPVSNPPSVLREPLRPTLVETPSTNSSAASLNARFAQLSDADKAAYYQNRGSDFMAQGQYALATSNYLLAAQLNPTDEDVHYNLGLALAKQGDIAAAKSHYLEALRLYPDFAEAHNNLDRKSVV